MLDWNVTNGLLAITAILVFIIFIKPLLRSKNIDYYEEIKLGLMLFGFTFRDDKIRQIANTVLFIVGQMEDLDLTPDEKHYLAIEEAFREILIEFNIELPEEAISLMIQSAVAMLPPTNK